MKIARIVVGYFVRLARELSDESAYERHLARGGTHSRAEWRRFIDRRLQRKYHHAKCC
jgi:hypothetical protein